MDRTGAPISGDQFVAMSTGPLLVATLEIMTSHNHPVWGRLMHRTLFGVVGLVEPLDMSSLGELSESDIEIMDEIVKQFADYSLSDLCEHINFNCSEFYGKNIGASISYFQVFFALGWSESDAQDAVDHIAEMRALTEFMDGVVGGLAAAPSPVSAVPPTRSLAEMLPKDGDNHFYYMCGELGMRSDGAFTGEKRHWMTFGRLDARCMADIGVKPNGAQLFQQTGVFVGTETGERLRPFHVAAEQDSLTAIRYSSLE